MQVQLKEWGNSMGIRLVQDVLKTTGFTRGDVLDISASKGQIVITKPFRHKTLEERAAEYGGGLMLDGEYDWGEPVGREIWS